MGGFVYLVGLPKRLQVATHFLHQERERLREDSLKQLAEYKIEREICPVADLNVYRAESWRDFSRDDSVSASIIHEFTCDESSQTYLFRMRYGSLSEVINMR